MVQENKQQNSVVRHTETGWTTLDFNQRVVLASKEPKLLYVKDIRTTWKQFIAKLNILLGGTTESLPTSEELEVMLNFALDNWFKYSLSDIELAVNANISRKTQEFVQYYGKISVSYLQSCIANYQEVKNKAILAEKRRADSERPRTLKEPDYIVNAKLYDGLVEFIRTQSRFPDFWDWNGVYAHMEAENLLKGITDAFKRDLYNKVKGELTGDRINERMKSRSLGDLAGADGMNSEERIKKECRRRIIKSLLIK